MADQTYSEPVGESWQYNPEYHRVADFLGVDKYERSDFDLANKISLIRDYVDLDSKSPEQALGQIHQLQKKLGVNTQGKTLVNQLYQHVRLSLDSKRSQTSKNQANPNPRKAPAKPSSVQDIVAKTVQASVAGMVQKALGDKKLISNTVQAVVKDALK